MASGRRSHTMVSAAAKRKSTTWCGKVGVVRGKWLGFGGCNHGPVAGTEQVEVVKKVTAEQNV